MASSFQDFRATLLRLQRRLLDRDRWEAAFTRNLPLKALSVGIAFALWTFVNVGERDAEVAYRVPLELTNIPAGLVISGPRIDDVDVRLVGSRTLLGRVDRKNLGITLNLEGVRPGPAAFAIGAERLNLPRGVRIVRINPAQVAINLERIAQKSVPIQLRVDQQPVADFVIAATVLTPDRVTISGPESVVKDIELVRTEALDLSRATPGTLEQEIGLTLPGEGTTLDMTTSVLTIQVEDVFGSRVLTDVPVELREGVGTAVIRPATVAVTVEGPQRLIRTLGLESAVAWVDVLQPGPGTFAAEPEVRLPEGVKLLSIVPRQVEVAFTVESSSSNGARSVVDSARR